MKAILKVTELRLNNYIKDGHDIEQISVNHLQCMVEDRCEFDPIPLTEEWHNKFGVEKNGFGSFEYIIPRNRTINLKVVFNDDYVFLRQGNDPLKSHGDDNLLTIWNKDLTGRDMYIHEWQNLWNALTGEELTEVKTKN